MQYKPLLIHSQFSEMAKEAMLDELEEEIFVNEPTHVGNVEMMQNLHHNNNSGISLRVSGAINQIAKAIGQTQTEINGVQYEIKALLMARWGQAGLSQGKMHCLGN